MRRLIVGLIIILGVLWLAYPDGLRQGYRDFARDIRPEPKPRVADEVRVYLHGEDRIVTLSMEEYLAGVVAAEMPADFPPEALKAQAVCARTYIVKRMTGGGTVNNPHPGADICDDPRHGQAWLSRDQLKARWGMLEYYRHYYKIRKAVEETRGVVITYKGQLIDPVYHSSCGGRTESAADVWQVDAPYLRSVECPYDRDPHPNERKTYTLAEVDAALGTDLRVLPTVSGRPPIHVLETTGTGRPKVLAVGGRRIAATVVRDRLDLRSTNFEIEYANGELTFITRGYGHGVGLCQYGAAGLAEHGRDYRTILRHYYQGVELAKLP